MVFLYFYVKVCKKKAFRPKTGLNYYPHGPLARVEIGDKKVQGIDYTYTIQGWQKSINSETLKETRDIGKDGYMTTNLDKHIGRDAYAYTLGYYAGDYTPKAGVSNAPAIAAVTSSDLLGARFNLYNGNISYMGTNLIDPSTGDKLPNGMAYKYDQLNRIKYAQGYANLDVTDNTWDYGSTYTGKYFNEYTYDFNGNIATTLVKNDAGTAIDQQTYNYYLNGSSKKLNNRLYSIDDAVSGAGGVYDLLDHLTAFDNTLATINSVNNYTYTEIGELKSDIGGEIDNIVRRKDGKIKEIVRTSGAEKNLKFDYDVTGDRVAKHVYSNANVWEESEYYVLDAEGNIVSTYFHTDPGTESFKLSERHIYGSSLIGIDAPDKELIGASVSSSEFNRTLGKKKYSGSNHLGNDLVVYSDRKTANATGSTINFYSATLSSARDFGVFGEYLTNRVFTPDAFPNSFNGKRDDEEVDGWQNYGFRNYLKYTRRLMDRVDPLTQKYPELTPYQFASNSPIANIDLDGLEKAPRHWDMTPEQIKTQRKIVGAGFIIGKTIAIGITIFTQPEIGIPWALTDITGAPVLPAPQAWSSVGVAVTEEIAISTSNSVNKLSAIRVIEEDGFAIVKDINGKVAGRAWLESSGELNLTIKTKGTELKGRGTDVFTSLYNYINENFSTISSIRGTWRAGEMGDNLNKFNTLVKGGMSEEEAALETFTGKVAKATGYTKPKIENVKKDADGNFISVDVTFNKPSE